MKNKDNIKSEEKISKNLYFGFKPFSDIFKLNYHLYNLTEDNEYINPEHKYLRLNAFKNFYLQIGNVKWVITDTGKNKLKVKTYFVGKTNKNPFVYKPNYFECCISTKIIPNKQNDIELKDVLFNCLYKNTEQLGFLLRDSAEPICYMYEPKPEYVEGIEKKRKELENDK